MGRIFRLFLCFIYYFKLLYPFHCRLFLAIAGNRVRAQTVFDCPKELHQNEQSEEKEADTVTRMLHSTRVVVQTGVHRQNSIRWQIELKLLDRILTWTRYS